MKVAGEVGNRHSAIYIEDAYGGSSPHPHTSCSYNLRVMFSSVAAVRSRNVKAAAGRVQGRNQFVFGVWGHPGGLLEPSWKQVPKNMTRVI